MRARFNGFTSKRFRQGAFTEGEVYEVLQVDESTPSGITSYEFRDDNGVPMWEDITAFTILPEGEEKSRRLAVAEERADRLQEELDTLKGKLRELLDRVSKVK